MGEFNIGDIIVQIGGNNVFIVSGWYESPPWYTLGWLSGDKQTILYADHIIEKIDATYVKVDYCSIYNTKETIKKLDKLMVSLKKGA